ncbi:MAG TPA: amylo-alpha-1,6-glucosidase, partial [Polyangiaceae bacterium]
SMKGPWPRAQVNGRLESAEMEWLHTNGAGAYSMSTVAMRHTRRYHGVFVAALNPPVDRFVVVSHAETTVVASDRSYRLAVQQSPDAAPTPGYRFLESFEQDPVPRWTYRLGKSRFERTLSLVRGKNALVAGYTWHGREPASLRLRPLMPMRRIHTLSREHGAMVQRVRLYPGKVEIQPVPTLPSVFFAHEGTFLGSPDWYRRLEYPEDKLRRADWQEDLWTPGSFEIRLEPGRTSHLIVALGALPSESPADLVAQTVGALRAEDPGDEHSLAVRELSVAAEQFCADACDEPTVVAGYPWLTALSRDALIALPGLYFVRGRTEGGKRVLSTLVRAMRDDLVPRRTRSTQEGDNALSADATMWLFEGVRQLVAITGANDAVVRETLYPALCRIFRRIASPRREVLWLAEDGLLASGDDEVALTWLDATTGATLATPRRGYAVELQALFSKGCDTLAVLAQTYGDTAMAEAAETAARRARATFASRFWCEATRYPYDCIRAADDSDGPVADSSVRPNALVALDVDPALFERWQAAAILERVRERLLTSRGVRSLDPDQPGYRGEYEGTFEERRLAYHQGLAWTHLIGAYARASLRLTPDDFDLQESLRLRIEEARVGGTVLGQVSQFSDGEPPHRPGGCPAQATSVAELLRTLVWDLGL